MAIQIPMVERAPVQDTPSVGRLDINLPNAQEAVAPQTKAVANITQEAFDLYNKKMDQAADNAANAAANEFRMRRNEALEGPDGLIFKTGDPTKPYQDFDLASNDLYEEIIGRYATANEKTKRAVQAKMGNAYEDIYNKRTVRYGKQFNDYADTVSNTTVEIMKRKLNDDAELVRIDDPNSVQPLKGSIVAIMDTRYREAERKGLATRNADGSWEANDIVNLQIAKDSSDAVRDVILTYTSANRPDLAEMVLQDKTMHNILDTGNMKQVKKAIEESKREVESTTVAQEAALQPDTESAYALIKKKIKDPITQDKARKNLDDIRSSQHTNYKRDQDSIYNKLSNQIQSIQEGQVKGVNPFVSVNQMESHPAIKPLLDRLEDGDKRKALRSIVKPPNQSDPKAIAEFMNITRKGGLTTMTGEEFVEKTKDMNQYDKGRMMAWWNAAKFKAPNPETAAAERARVDDMNQKMLAKARLYNIVPKKGAPETWRDDDRQLFDTLSSGFMDKISDPQNSKLSQKEQSDLITNYLIDYMNENPRSPGFMDKLFGGGSAAREYIIPERPASQLGAKRLTPTGQSSGGSKVTPYFTSMEQVPDADLDYYTDNYKKSGGKVSDRAAFLKWINDNPRGSR